MFLRQSTAGQEVKLGPFVDSTDGVTPENALTIANTDIKLFKTGATSQVNKNSGGATYITSSNGHYYAVFDTTDSDTIGPMDVDVYVSGALPVQKRLVVLDEAVYDVIFGTTALSTYAGGAVASVTGNVGGNVTGSVGSVAAGGITAASLAADCITAAKVAADVTTEIQTGLATAAELAKVPKSDGVLTFNLTCVSDIKSGLATPSNILGAAVPGAYGAGTLAKVVGDNLDTTVSSRLATSGYTAPLDAAGVRGAVGLAAANLDTQLADLPTVAEFEARTLPSADYVVVGDTLAGVTTVTDPVTLADGAHGGASATLTLKSVAVTNSDNGGTAVGIVANGVGGTGLLVSGTADDIVGDLNGTVAALTANNDKTGYALGVGGIDATAFAAGAIDAAAIAANAIGASELAQDAAREIADEVLDRNLTGGGSGGARNVRSALRRLRNRVAVAAGVATVYAEDDATSAWTAAVTTAAGDPVTEVDPS